MKNFYYSKKLGVGLAILLVLPSLSWGADLKLDEWINEQFMPVANWWEKLIFTPLSIYSIQIPIVLLLLVVGGLFFTGYFAFINIRKLPLAIRIVRGTYDPPKSAANAGEVSHFQALATAVSGTVGLGNISMVAVAISVGGPGATFWMVLGGLLGMSTKFVECTLGVKYREIDGAGKVYGGPMYYLQKGLKEVKKPRLGKLLSTVFAILCLGASFGGGNAFQSNQASAQILSLFPIHHPSAGTFLGCTIAAVAGIVIIGGIKRIAHVTEKIVPFMALVYVAAASFILASHFTLIDDAIRLILAQAFTPEATVTGGVFSVVIQGFKRGAFSNEAGAGSAAIAHAAVKTEYPASEGLVALLEPLIDTIVVCSMTALVLILFNMQGSFEYGIVQNNQVSLSDGRMLGGVNLTSEAFETLLPGFSYVLSFAVVLFAFSTILSWSYYGIQAWKFLFGRKKWSDLAFKILYLTFTVLGGAITLDAVIKFSDAMMLALVFPNMIGLLILFPKVKTELKLYLKHLQQRSKRSK